MLGVICDRRVPAKIKGVQNCAETSDIGWPRDSGTEERQEAEMKILRFSLEVRMDRIRNEYIRGTAHVRGFGKKVREARLTWFGHVQRTDTEYIGKTMLRFKLPGRRPGRRPKRKFIDLVKEDRKVIGLSEEDAEDRVSWRQLICCRKIFDFYKNTLFTISQGHKKNPFKNK